MSAEEISQKSLTKISKLLSLVLRHQPEVLGLSLDSAGWIPTSDLIAASNDHGHPLNLELLKKVVAENEKKRFEFDKDGSHIRASQGHSVPVELGYTPQVPPPLLFHGTVDRFLSSIREAGLIKGDRQHVHLSADEKTAANVGSRRGKPVILKIRSFEMHAAGHAFYISSNGVWLVDAVPPEFISFPEAAVKPIAGRAHRARLAESTLQYIEGGGYHNAERKWVPLRRMVDEAVAGTLGISPEADLPAAMTHQHATQWEVLSATTIEVLLKLNLEGARGVGCLNFASAKNAGGGFLNGSKAQEESLACSSGLYPCLRSCPTYYEANRACGTTLYTDWIIWSPRVPFIRRDDGSLLDAPVLADVITAPAPNAGAIAHSEPQHLKNIRPTLEQRAFRVCSVASSKGIRTLVLGAWGCGVFRNDPQMVAEVFAKLLGTGGPLEGVFERLVFAIYDSGPETPVLNAFRNTLPSPP